MKNSNDIGKGNLSIIEKVYCQKNLKMMLYIQLVLLYIPSVNLFTISVPSGVIPASLCYFFSAIFLPFLLYNCLKIKIPKWYVTIWFIYIILLALIRAPQYGVSKGILHWVFGFYLLIVVTNVGLIVGKDYLLEVLELGICTFFIMHLVLIIRNWEVVLWLIRNNFMTNTMGGFGDHLPSLTRGGRNLDASWLALGVFFIKKKKNIWFVTYAFIFAFIGGSRVGIVASVIVLTWIVMSDRQKEGAKRKHILKWVIYGVIMLSILFGSGLAQASLYRMGVDIPAPGKIIGMYEENFSMSEGSDEVSNPSKVEDVSDFLSGRAAIWTIAPKMFLDNPWGYGVGNAMRIMKKEYGFSGFEDVVHNVFMQWSLDEGIIGGVYYLTIVISFVVMQIKKGKWFREPYAAYFATYIVLSLVQYHGAEALMFFSLGCYLVYEECYTKLFKK